MKRRPPIALVLPSAIPRLPPPGFLTDEQIAEGIAYLNANVAWIFDGRNTLVIRGEHPTLGTPEYRLSTLAEFRAWLAYHRISSGRGSISLAELWLREHSGAHRYEGLACHPAGCPPNIYNLWMGWGVQAIQGSWSRHQDHLYEIVCGANDYLYGWVFNWLARMVQVPGEPAGTAIVLRGAQGAGKGVLWRLILRIAGGHGVYLSHTSSLTNRFNAPLAGKVFMFADEVIWGGDHVGAQPVKALITESQLALEKKGRDVIHIKNILHIGMASNNDHVAHVEAGDRRYVILDVLDTYCGQNRTYHQPLHDAIGDSAPALLYDLLQVDLSNWDPFTPPETAARIEQAIRSLSANEVWIYEALRDGVFMEAEWVELRELKTTDVYAAYLAHTLKRRLSRTLSETEFGILFIRSTGAKKVRRRTAANGLREYWYVLPSLAQARETFSQRQRKTLPWPVDADE